MHTVMHSVLISAVSLFDDLLMIIYSYVFGGFVCIIVHNALFPKFSKAFSQRSLSSWKLTLSLRDSECNESDDASAPFFDALVTTRRTLQHRYFFPGHGGMIFPKFVKDIGRNFFLHDLPELDGLDNIHFPEVTISF